MSSPTKISKAGKGSNKGAQPESSSAPKRRRGRPAIRPLRKIKTVHEIAFDDADLGDTSSLKRLKVGHLATSVTTKNNKKDDNQIVTCTLCNNDMNSEDFHEHNMTCHSNLAITTTDNIMPDQKFYEARLKEFMKHTKVSIITCPYSDCDSTYKTPMGLATHILKCEKNTDNARTVPTTKRSTRRTSKMRLANETQIGASETKKVQKRKNESSDKLVTCKLCQVEMLEQSFQSHNIKLHSNIATTTDDPTIPEHKFYERRLKHLRRIAGITVFICPNTGCDSSYKSTLGLAYHLEKCGKSKEEIDQCLATCDICFKKFNLPGLLVHKKSHLREMEVSPSPRIQREAAKRAAASTNLQLDLSDEESTTSKNRHSRKDVQNLNAAVRTGEFSHQASVFLQPMLRNPNLTWAPSNRVNDDIFSAVTQNTFKPMTNATPFTYQLPKESVSFVTNVEIDGKVITAESKRLSFFSGTHSDKEQNSLIYFVGGPVLDLAWHPSSKALAVSALLSPKDEINLKIKTTRNSNIYVFYHEESENSLELKLIIASKFGYATSLHWGNLWPEFWDENFTQKSRSSSNRVATLACCYEDGTIRIYMLCPEDFRKQNAASVFNLQVPIYSKTSEVCLKLPENLYQHSGQICKFDWSDNNRLLVAGFCSGLVGLFDLLTDSILLREKQVCGGANTTIIYPFWVFQGHAGPITAIGFDQSSWDYFFTASKDHFMKFWDIKMRTEVENRKIGVMLDGCWIRGWLHVILSIDNATWNLSSFCNFARFYQIGQTPGRPNTAECLNISSLAFHNGLTAQTTEDGNVSVSYFDNFWREFDYERNRKKGNAVIISKIEVDASNLKRLSKEDFPKEDVYDSVIPNFEPRIIFNFYRKKLKPKAMEGPTPEFFEDYGRFFSYLRTNKVKWSPNGKYVTVGYQNGIVTIIPFSADTSFSW